MIAAGVAVPILGTIAVQSFTMKPDLYYLAVRADGQSHNPEIIGWPGLTGKPCDCRVRMLGYMMDNQRPFPDGTSVSSFLLAPDAGTLLIPAPGSPRRPSISVFEQAASPDSRAVNWSGRKAC